MTDEIVSHFGSFNCAESVVGIMKPFKLAKKTSIPKTVIRVGDVSIGNGDVVMIAGLVQ